MDKLIIPECFADTLLIETLVPTERGYNHQHSCFKVEATMKGMDNFALGVIDNDKRQIKYLDHFLVIDEVEGALILWRHNNKQRHHYLIQICPALERWILNVCGSENINVVDFGLENDLDAIKRQTKSASSLHNPKLKSLFEEINRKNENESVRKLKGWITLLKDKHYQVDINELKNA
jgi:hypothetical protein